MDINRLLERCYPATCLLCGAEGYRGRDLCRGCLGDLPYNDNACPRCALPLPATAAGSICGACLGDPPPFDQAQAVFRYQPPVDYLIRALKFNGRLAAGRLLAALMSDYFSARSVIPDALVSVPLHSRRLRQRGFDQTLELARPLARQLDIPLIPNLARRIRPTVPQSQLTGQARRHNIKGIFALDKPTTLNHIAIVDDVMTSGSTVAELARLLRQAGVARIQVWVCARTSASPLV